MKTNMIYSLGIGLIAMSMMSACEGDPKINSYEYPEPTVTQVTPTTGYAYSQVAIEGTNFGDRKKPVTITFGGVVADSILSVQNNRIIVVIPKDAESGTISLKVWTHTLDSIGDYTVIPTPELYGVESTNAVGQAFAQENDELTITGRNFGDNIDDVKVTVAGVQATVTSLSNEMMKVTVPAFERGGNVVVQVRDIVMQGPAVINPNATGDLTDLFLKNYQAPFERTVIGDSEWAKAANWLFDGLANSGNTLQFESEDYPNGVLVLRGASKQDNAHMSQIVTLPKGDYEFQITIAEDLNGGQRYGASFAVSGPDSDAGGDPVTFPNLTEARVGDIKAFRYTATTSTLLTYISVSNNGVIATPYTADLNLPETTKVRIGFAWTLYNANSQIKISSIKIIRK